jgi:hypothetical protein
MGSLEQQLDGVITRFIAIVNNPNGWPKFEPADTSLKETGEHLQLVTDLENFHTGDSTTGTYKRSGRILAYWDLFKRSVAGMTDTLKWNALIQQIDYFAGFYSGQQTSAETNLIQALRNAAANSKSKEEKTVVAQQAGGELEELIEKINNSNDPEYLLDKAVRELNNIKGNLNPATHSEDIAMINKYLKKARELNKKNTYNYRIESISPNGHAHVDVAPPGEEPAWSTADQWLPGFDYTITWKPGYTIYIAYDDRNQEETWGKTATDKKVLRDKYSLFNMDGEITFSSGQKVIISFEPPLKSKLPKLEK